MHERDHDRRRERDQTRSPEPLPPPRSSADAVLALQRAIGNHGTARVLAREDKNRPSFPHSVKIGTLGPIEIKGGNIEDWVAKKDPDDLKVISDEGKTIARWHITGVIPVRWQGPHLNVETAQVATETSGDCLSTSIKVRPLPPLDCSFSSSSGNTSRRPLRDRQATCVWSASRMAGGSRWSCGSSSELEASEPPSLM